MVSGVVSSVGILPPCAAPGRPWAATRTTRQVANFLTHICPSTRGYSFTTCFCGNAELGERLWRSESEGQQVFARGKKTGATRLDIDRHNRQGSRYPTHGYRR